MFKPVLAGILAVTLSYTPPGNLHGYWMFLGDRYFHDAKHILESPSVWAVVRSEGGYSLESVTLSVEHIQQKGADGKVTYEDDRLRVSGGKHPSFLIGGLKNPRPGPLAVASVDPVFLSPGVCIELSLPEGGDKLTLRASGVPDRGQKKEPEDYAKYAIEIERKGESSQTLTTDFFPERDYDHVRVQWSGDVDQDGRIDVMFEYSFKEIGSTYILMLSSERRLNQLLCPVARFSSSC